MAKETRRYGTIRRELLGLPKIKFSKTITYSQGNKWVTVYEDGEHVGNIVTDIAERGIVWMLDIRLFEACGEDPRLPSERFGTLKAAKLYVEKRLDEEYLAGRQEVQSCS